MVRETWMDSRISTAITLAERPNYFSISEIKVLQSYSQTDSTDQTRFIFWITPKNLIGITISIGERVRPRRTPKKALAPLSRRRGSSFIVFGMFVLVNPLAATLYFPM